MCNSECASVGSTYLGRWMRFKQDEDKEAPLPDIHSEHDEQMEWMCKLLIGHMLCANADNRYAIGQVCSSLQHIQGTRQAATMAAFLITNRIDDFENLRQNECIFTRLELWVKYDRFMICMLRIIGLQNSRFTYNMGVISYKLP
jgi:hypothetical protein